MSVTLEQAQDLLALMQSNSRYPFGLVVKFSGTRTKTRALEDPDVKTSEIQKIKAQIKHSLVQVSRHSTVGTVVVKQNPSDDLAPGTCTIRPKQYLHYVMRSESASLRQTSSCFNTPSHALDT